MAETKNIAEMAAILSDDLFAEFLWIKTGPADQNWPCEDQPRHKTPTHPSDVVFYYNNPYSLSRTYVNCDLKSYAGGTITRAKITPSIESLGRSINCAEKSADWQKKYVSDQVNSVVCGLLFVYNHDGAYDKEFKEILRDSKPNLANLPRESKLFVLGPEDIFWLNNVRYEIVQMRGKNILPPSANCRFFYPNLVRKNNVQPEHANAATLEMLTGPWIVLSYTDPATKRNGFVIFYRRSGDSVLEFLYFIDYLMYYQILQSNTDVHLRTLVTSPNAPAFFQKAIREYTEQCDNSEEIRGLLEAIKYSQINDIHTQFSQVEIGMDHA